MSKKQENINTLGQAPVVIFGKKAKKSYRELFKEVLNKINKKKG